MKWVKLTDGLPKHGTSALVENQAGEYFRMEFSGMVGKDWYERNLKRWLNETPNTSVQSFTLEDMNNSYKSGKIAGFEHCQSGSSSETFNWFIKREYNIEIP